MTGADQFAAFIAGLPPSMEMDLMASEPLATAFFRALGRGWTLDQVVGDAAFAVRGGAGTGLLVDRLKRLATMPPPERKVEVEGPAVMGPLPECYECGRAYPRGFHPENCAGCGLPLRLVEIGFKSETTVRHEHVAERRALLTLIADLKMGPDTAEAAMKNLIAEQNGERL